MSDFIRDVMQKTAGSPCEQARRLMSARESDPLLAGHLEHCHDCRAFEAALAILDETLPAMAAVDPGPAFTEAVLDTTSRNPAPLPLIARIDAFFGRLFGWLKPIAARPRFGLELGYVGAMVIWILFGLPDTTNWQQVAEWDRHGERIEAKVRELTDFPEAQAIADTSGEIGDAAREFDLLRGSLLVGELATQVLRLPTQLFNDEEPNDAEGEPANDRSSLSAPATRQAC